MRVAHKRVPSAVGVVVVGGQDVTVDGGALVVGGSRVVCDEQTTRQIYL